MEFWLAIQCNRARARGGSHLVALFLRHDEVAWSMGKLVAVLLVSMQFGLIEKVLSGNKRGLLVTTVSRESLRRRSAAVPL